MRSHKKKVHKYHKSVKNSQRKKAQKDKKSKFSKRDGKPKQSTTDMGQRTGQGIISIHHKVRSHNGQKSKRLLTSL